METTGRTVLIYGLGLSGLAAAKVLAGHGDRVLCLDDSEKVRQAAGPSLEQIGAEWVSADRAGEASVMILSPGIPVSHPLVKAFRDRGGDVIGELELAFRLSKSPWLAVTGTNGKTTTTSLIGALFEASTTPALVGGNIGLALADRVRNAELDQWVVAEISSFQLETIGEFRPRIAVMTNLRPDHLDRYRDMDEYGQAKARIFENMGAGDTLVLNAADKNLENLTRGCKARIVLFSSNAILEKGLWVEGDWIMARLDEEDAGALVQLDDLAIPGPHNIENALAAAAAGLAAGLPRMAVVAGLKNFKGVAHRLEDCGVLKGIAFTNDSKGTNVDSVEKALQSFSEPLLLILGGRDKSGDFKKLKPFLESHVIAVCLVGEAADKIEKQLGDFKPMFHAKDMKDAVGKCFSRAEAGQRILLSPGCASFDMFKNYEERGNVFKEAVKDLEAHP